MPSLNSLTDVSRFASTLHPEEGEVIKGKVLDLIQHLQSYDFNGKLDRAGFSKNAHARLYRRLKSAAAGEMAKKPKRRKAGADGQPTGPKAA